MLRLVDDMGKAYYMREDDGALVQAHCYKDGGNGDDFSGQWRATGFSTNRGWNVRAHPDVSLAAVVTNPSRAIGTHPFDYDHGYARLWGASIIVAHAALNKAEGR